MVAVVFVFAERTRDGDGGRGHQVLQSALLMLTAGGPLGPPVVYSY